MSTMNLKLDKIVCLIPARGGSIGIPRKNLLEINGLPLVEHSIRQAQSDGLEHIIVSSDSEEILEIARQYSVYALKRPDEICGATSSTEEAMTHAMLSYEKQTGNQYNSMIVLQPTSPIRFKGTIAESIDRYYSDSYDSLVGV